MPPVIKHRAPNIQLARGATENGIVIGNTTDKYQSVNPVVRRLMTGFTRSFESLVRQVEPSEIHEVGCGEGYWSIRLAQAGYRIRGSDFSSQVVALARDNSATVGLSIPFQTQSIYDLRDQEDAANLIICCEVFEHLENPEQGLGILARLARPYLLISVPREPTWRLLNMARGKYWSSLGNTPGHLQHWSKRSFLRFLAQRFEIVDVRSPMPWTMALCRIKKSAPIAPSFPLVS